VDGFRVGSKVIEEMDKTVKYGGWQGKKNAGASGGTFRLGRRKLSYTRLSFTGTGVDWITAKGPRYGIASVFIDGVLADDNIDLYDPDQLWQVPISFNGLEEGNHTIEVRPLNKKNPNSQGKSIVIDAFRAPITP
jgi:hypothetical protein